MAPADVYKVLATADGVDRAFHKLDQLKPYLVWWQTGADAVHILSSGDVLMTSAPSDQIALAARNGPRNFGMQWTASLGEVKSWAIAKGSPNLRQAMQFLYFAGTPAIEGRLLSGRRERSGEGRQRPAAARPGGDLADQPGQPGCGDPVRRRVLARQPGQAGAAFRCLAGAALSGLRPGSASLD